MERAVLEQLDALRKNFKDKQAELFAASLPRRKASLNWLPNSVWH